MSCAVFVHILHGLILLWRSAFLSFPSTTAFRCLFISIYALLVPRRYIVFAPPSLPSRSLDIKESRIFCKADFINWTKREAQRAGT